MFLTFSIIRKTNFRTLKNLFNMYAVKLQKHFQKSEIVEIQILFFGLVRQKGVHGILYLNTILDYLYHYWFVSSVHTSITSSGDPLSTANGYRVFQQDGSGKCTLIIIGHGVDTKVVKSSCKTKTPSLINLHKSLLVGNYFTDTPGVLIHFIDGNCERVYGDRTTRLNDVECEEVKRKVVMLREAGAQGGIEPLGRPDSITLQ